MMAGFEPPASQHPDPLTPSAQFASSTAGPRLLPPAASSRPIAGHSKASDTQFGYSGASAAHHIIIHCFGGDVLDAHRKKSRLSEPEAITATEWIHDLIYEHKAHPAPDQIQNGSDTNMFAGGKVAMLQSVLRLG